MQRSYRGISYQYNSAPTEMTEGEMTGTYRGVTLPLRHLRSIPIPQSNFEMRYRGYSAKVLPSYETQSSPSVPRWLPS